MTERLGEDWTQQYQAWMKRSRTDLVAKKWTEAFRTYPWPTYGSSPWTTLKKPLSHARVAVISSSGLTSDDDEPFDESILEGDRTWRLVPADRPLGQWTIRHGHYDPASAHQDYNTVFPTDVLNQLAREGIIGSVAPRAISFIGFQTDAAHVLNDWGPEFGAALAEDQVDAVLLVPV